MSDGNQIPGLDSRHLHSIFMRYIQVGALFWKPPVAPGHTRTHQDTKSSGAWGRTEVDLYSTVGDLCSLFDQGDCCGTFEAAPGDESAVELKRWESQA